MSIVIVSNHLPQLGLNAANAIPKLGPVLVKALAINAISNLPLADALGSTMKYVDKECYSECKEHHKWKAQLCFWSCMIKNDKLKFLKF